MRALQPVDDHQIRVQDVPVPDIAPDEALVRVAGADVTVRDLPDRTVIDGARRCLGSPQRVARRR